MGARDVVFTILAIDEASAKLARVGSEAEVLGGKMGKSGRIVGNAMNVIGLATAAVAVKSIELGAKFQSTMEQLATQAHVPQKQVDSLSQSVLNLAGKVGEGPDSLAEALYHIESSFASTGITGAKAMHLLETASKGAKVGHADLVDVTNALDAAVVSGIPGVKNFDQAMGMLNATVGAGDMHMQDLADAFGTGAVAVVKGYGLSLRDVGSALAVFGDNNIRGAEAGTALRMTVQSLAVPAKGGAAALRDLGLKSDTLAKAMATGGLSGAVGLLVASLHKAGVSSADMGKNSKKLAEDLKNGDLTKAMQDIGTKSGTMGDLLTRAFGKKAGIGLQMLVDQFDRLKSKYKEVDKGAKTFGDSWKDQQKTLLQQWDQLKSAAEALFTKIGLKLIPVVLDLGKKFGDAGDKLEPVINFIGQHSTIFGSVAVAIGTVIAAVKTWTLVTKTLAVAQAALDVVLNANPIGIVVIAIAALTAGIIYAYKHSETFRNIVDSVWGAIKTIVMTNVKIVVGLYLWFADMIVGAAAKAFGWVPGLGPKLTAAAAAVHGFRDKVNAYLDGITKQTVAEVNVSVKVNGKPVNVHGNALAGFNMTSTSGGHTQTVRAYATGGRPAPGQPSLVGENGPELFWPDQAGTIIPNHEYAAKSRHRHPQMVSLGSSIINGVTDGLKQAAPKAYEFLRSFELKIADIKVSSTVRDGIKKAADRIGAQMVLTTGQVQDLTKRIAAQKQAVADLFKQRDEYANTLAGGASGGGVTNIGLLELDDQGRNKKAQDDLDTAQQKATDTTQKYADAQDHLNDLMAQQAARQSNLTDAVTAAQQHLNDLMAQEAARKTSTVAQLQAMRDAQQAVTDAQASAAAQDNSSVAQLQALADAQKAVTDAQTANADAQSKLSTAQDTAKTANTNQATDFLDQLKSRVAAIKDFSGNMNKLKAEGLSQSVLQQIAQAGLDTGGALAKALAEQGTPATIKAISSMDKQINDASTAFGKTWAAQMYNTGIDAANGILKGLQSKQGDLLAMIREMAQSVVAEIKKTLKIKSPSGVMADEVGAMIPAGIAAGMDANAHLVTTAARGLVPSTAGAYGASGGRVGSVAGGVTNIHLHVPNGFVGSPDQLATALSDVISRAKARGLNLSFA